MLLKCGCTQRCRNKHLCRSKCALTWHRRADIPGICSLCFVVIGFHHSSSKWMLCECQQTWSYSMRAVFLPHSWQLFISNAERTPRCCVSVLSAHILIFILTSWSACPSFFCHVLTHLQAGLSFFAAVCVLPPFPDPPLIHSLPSASENIPRQAAVSYANAGMWIQNCLHYVMKGDSISMRHPVYKCQRSLVPGKITFRFLPDWSQCWSHS